MGRYDNVNIDSIKNIAGQGLYFPCLTDRNICLLTSTGVFMTGIKKDEDTLVAKFLCLSNSGREALHPVTEIPASVVDGAIKPGTPGIPGVPASAQPGTEYTYLRTDGDYPGTVDSEVKAICKAIEGCEYSEITKEILNEFFDECPTGSPLLQTKKAIIVVVTTVPKTAQKSGRLYTAHSFSHPNDADLKVAAEAMARLGLA